MLYNSHQLILTPQGYRIRIYGFKISNFFSLGGLLFIWARSSSCPWLKNSDLSCFILISDKHAAKEANRKNWKFARNCRSLVWLAEQRCDGLVSWLECWEVWVWDEPAGERVLWGGLVGMHGALQWNRWWANWELFWIKIIQLNGNQ